MLSIGKNQNDTINVKTKDNEKVISFLVGSLLRASLLLNLMVFILFYLRLI